jgi:glutamine amidotransferase
VTAIAVLDYGMGNRRSVEKALERVGARAKITRQPDDVRAADGLIVPGVGAFPEAMRRLRDGGLDALIRERVEAGGPVLGICLGMQLLFERSTEHEGADGLGLLAGQVTRLSPLTAGLPDACAFYHVHSFAARPTEEGDTLGVAEYGEPFASVVARDPLFGVQFHPEKSSAHGLRLLENFAAVCARVAA